MALRMTDGVRERIAQDLRAFFEPHGTTDRNFDDFCGWMPGTTRELLDGNRAPTPEELIEICLRLNHPLSLYVQTAYVG